MPQPPLDNLFAGISGEIPEEIIEVLLQTPGFRLERLISAGQASPPRPVVRPGEPRMGGAAVRGGGIVI